MNLNIFGAFLRLYWRSIIVVLVPICLIPVITANDYRSVRYLQINYSSCDHYEYNYLHICLKDFKCLYVVLLMAIFWVTEALPLPITSMIPIVLFPCFSILVSIII